MPRRRCSREISVRIWPRSLASRFDNGSSKRNASAWRTMARPIATRRRWPPERFAGLRSRCSLSSSTSAASVTRRRTSSSGVLDSRGGRAMFSYTVMCGYGVCFWHTMDRLQSRGARSLPRYPPMIMSPLVMSSSPTIILSSVDFPQPDGPTRIMNSPSAMSRLTSFTAGKPSPYCLTMLRISIEAMRSRPLAGWWIRGSALDRAVGETGDDAPLEEQHEDDDRDGDDDRRRGDRPGRVLELRGTGEQAQRGGYRPRRLGRGQRDAVREVVPGDEEGDDRGGEDARGGQRHDHLAERLPGGRTVDLRGLLHLPGDLPEERRHRPDGDRQRERQVRDDEPGPGVVEADLPPQVEQRRHDRDDREDRHAQCRREDQPLAGEVQPGDGVRGEHRQDARDERRDQADAERVPQRRQEEPAGRPGEDRRVVLPGHRRRQERLVGDVRRRLERQRHDPRDREQRVEDDQDPPDDPPGLLPLGHQPSPLAWARSIRKPLMKMNAISTTLRNSRTETAEPKPISTRAIVCR